MDELHKAATSIDVEKVGRSRGITTEDYVLRELEPALARCVPELLADLIRRKLQSFDTCPPQFRYWSAEGATAHFVLAGEEEKTAARELRLGGKEADETEEVFASNRLLLMEVRDMEPQAQYQTLIQADLKFIVRDFLRVLRPPDRDGIDTLIARYHRGSKKMQDDLLTLLACHPQTLSDNAWSWIMSYTNQEDIELQSLAFKVLTHADPTRFGHILDEDGWSWKSDRDSRVNHYGTCSLISVTSDLPFGDVAPRLAPWQLLKAARLREKTLMRYDWRLASSVNCCWKIESRYHRHVSMLN